MTRVYSTYEAKARFSELLRQVRAGERVFISYRGNEVAEIRPIEESESPRERLLRLEQKGVVSRSPLRRGELRTVEPRPGALRRFLAIRDRFGSAGE